MARTSRIIPGLNNGQKFRFIVRQPDVVAGIDFGMTLTIQEFFDKCATTLVRNAVTEGLATVAVERVTGLVKRINMRDHIGNDVAVDVQVDLM